MNPDHPHSPAATHEELDFKGLLQSMQRWTKFLLRKKIWIIGLFILGIVAGVGYSLFSVTEYDAKASFVLDEQSVNNNPLGGMSGTGLSAFGMNASAEANLFAGDNLIWLYTSKRMIGETLMTRVEDGGEKRLLLAWFIEINNDLRKFQEKLKKDNPGHVPISNASTPENLSVSQTKVLNYAINLIRNDYLEVNLEDHTTGIISVRIIAKDELFALRFVDEIVSRVNTFYINTKTKKNLQQVEVLQEKANEINKNMTGSMQSAAMAMDNIPYANPLNQELKVQPQRRAVDVQVNSTIYGSIIQQLELARITLNKETPLIQVIDQPAIPLTVVRPNPILWAIIGGMLALVLSIGFFIGKKVINDALGDKPE